VPLARRSTRSARLPSTVVTTTASRGRRWGSWVSPPMKTRHSNHRGAATLPARRSTRATCRDRPRHHLPTAEKCRRRDNRRWLRVTRLRARACVKQLAPPKRTNRRSTLAWRPAGRAPLSRRDPHLAKSTPAREGQTSGRRLPAGFTMAPTAPTLTPCRGADRGGSRRTQRRHRARRRRRIQVLPRRACSHCLSGAAEPQTFTCPSSLAGATIQPRSSRRPGCQPPSKQGSELPLLG
jgi:hypothetical protein